MVPLTAFIQNPTHTSGNTRAKAIKMGVGDGGRFIRWYELQQAHALLKELGMAEPPLLSRDPSTAKRFEWKHLVYAATRRQ